MNPVKWFLPAAALAVCAVSISRPLVAAPADKLYVEDVAFALEHLEKECGHFFKQKGIDWKTVSKQFLLEARNVKGRQEHLMLLWRLLARLEDGHAQVRLLAKGRSVRLPDDFFWARRGGSGMFWCRSGNKILVKKSWAGAAKAGIRPGVEIVQVNREPALKWIQERVEEYSDRFGFSTDQQAFFYATHWGLTGDKGKRLDLVIRNLKGKKQRGAVVFSGASQDPDGPVFLPKGLQRTNDLKYGRTKKGWGYIHVRRCPGNLPQQIDEALNIIGRVPGMILDFRGNSGGGFDHDAFMGRFIPKGKTIRFGKSYQSAGTKPYGGPMIIIVDATVRSAGETAAGIFKEDGRAYMIGESPTAGMSSSKKTIELPSRLFSLYVSVYSNKKRFQQGKGIEGIGVIPHEIVSYRAKDLAREIDTLIARAEVLLAKFPQAKVSYNPARFGWKGTKRRR